MHAAHRIPGEVVGDGSLIIGPTAEVISNLSGLNEVRALAVCGAERDHLVCGMRDLRVAYGGWSHGLENWATSQTCVVIAHMGASGMAATATMAKAFRSCCLHGTRYERISIPSAPYNLHLSKGAALAAVHACRSPFFARRSWRHVDLSVHKETSLRSICLAPQRRKAGKACFAPQGFARNECYV